MEENKKLGWEILIGAGAIIFTILGVVVPLFMHLDNKFYQLVESHYKEMKEMQLDMRK